jgi:predicted MFS family arabinose efflux permease
MTPPDAGESRAQDSARADLPDSSRRGTIFVYALTCGIMVGNLYICQPLLNEIALNLRIAEPVAGLVTVAAQVGYALGILLLVPLADIAEPARLIRWLIVATTAGLVAAAAAPGVAVLIAASLVFAAATVVPQILVPLATALVVPERRGRVIATLQTGFILGILLSRTVSGTVASMAGTWRAPFLLAAIGTGALYFILPRYLPKGARGHARSYGSLLWSMVPLLKHRLLRTSMALGFCMFGAFSVFWSTLAFHLASPAFGLGAAAAGLFGLWGAPGAIIAPIAGRLADRIGSAWVNCASLACAALAFLVAGTLGTTSVIALVLVVNLLDFGLQSGQIANQTRIFTFGAAVRARVNTVYMVAAFAGGAFGSLGGTMAWHFAGWRGACALSIGLVAIGGLVLALSTFRKPGPA